MERKTPFQLLSYLGSLSVTGTSSLSFSCVRALTRRSSPEKFYTLAGATTCSSGAFFTKNAAPENRFPACLAGPGIERQRGRSFTKGGLCGRRIRRHDVFVSTVRAGWVASHSSPQGIGHPRNNKEEPQSNFGWERPRSVLYRHPHEATIKTVFHRGQPPGSTKATALTFKLLLQSRANVLTHSPAILRGQCNLSRRTTNSSTVLVRWHPCVASISTP